jgi:hypothetical protein
LPLLARGDLQAVKVPACGIIDTRQSAIADEPEGHGGRDDVRSRYFVVEPDGAQLRELASLVDRGQLTAAVSQVLAPCRTHSPLSGRARPPVR